MKLHDITIRYEDEKTPVERLNLELIPGHRYAFCGRSGSGKTSLFRVIAGLQAPTEGTVEYDIPGAGSSFTGNSSFAGMSGHSPRFSMVFQEQRLLEQFSCLRNVLFVCGDSPEKRQRALSDMALLLPDIDPAQKAGTLSGGEKRRLSIIRAMNAESCDILLMDEPFAGLDEETKLRTAHYIADRLPALSEGGLIFLFSAHDAEDAQLFDAEVITIGNGCDD